MSATPHEVFRTPALIASSDPECYKVGLQLRGPCLFTQGEREAVLKPGDFTIYETGRPYAMRFDQPYQQLVLMLPRSMFRLPGNRIREISGRRVSGAQGVGAVFSALLRKLSEQFDAFSGSGDARLADNILDLLATVYAEDPDAPAVERRPLLLTILSYIECHLSEPDLTPDRIAAAHYISTRYLHKLFHEEQTTVAGWIRERRLAHCRHDLRDRSQANRPVSVIAAGWGFAEPAHFSRVFRAAYGTTPNAYRNA
ncbi:helix-turn-helix domain-containing protein [Catenulispora yoronensis]